MNQELFIQTLKAIKFPGVKKYSATDFDSMFSDPALQPFLNYFCTFNEDNVLTSEELDEYTSIKPDELMHFENLLLEEKTYVTNEAEADHSEETEYLNDQLCYVEKYSKNLQEQKDFLRNHQVLLSEEKSELENRKLTLRKLHGEYSIKVPQAQSQLSSTIKTVSELITELNSIVNTTENEKNMLPNFNIKHVEEYFEDEEKILSHVKSYLQSNFQFTDETKSILKNPGLSKDRILKEINILRNPLKISKMSEFKSVCAYKKKEAAAKLFKEYEDGQFPNICEISPSLLSDRLSEETLLHEQLIKKEEMLLSYLSNAVSERVDAQCCEITIARSNEILQDYKHNLKKISSPLSLMVNQRCRLQLLFLYLNLHQQYLHNIKILIDKTYLFTESEHKSYQEVKERYEVSCSETPKEEIYIPPDSILFSAYKILSDNHDPDNICITICNFNEEIKRLQRRKENVIKLKEDKNNVIDKLEKQYSVIEKYVFKGNKFFEFKKLEKNFSMQLNHLEVLLKEVHGSLAESKNYWDSKNKLLDTNRNLRIARSLYIWAFLDEKKFKHIIDKLKKIQKYAIDNQEN